MSEVLRGGHMKCNNRYQPDSLRVEGLDDRAQPLVIHYNFRIPDVVGGQANERYVPLSLDLPWRVLVQVHQAVRAAQRHQLVGRDHDMFTRPGV